MDNLLGAVKIRVACGLSSLSWKAGPERQLLIETGNWETEKLRMLSVKLKVSGGML